MILDDYDSDEGDIISPKLLKKYIAYARQHINPKLNNKATTILKEYYIKMRNINNGSDAIPIGTRQLEGMVRLTQAHAKMRLSNNATEKDAIIAINVMGNYLKQMGYDEISDTFDIDKIVGTTSNQRQKISIVRDALSNLQSEQNKPVEICILKEKVDRKSTRLNSSHIPLSRMPSSA